MKVYINNLNLNNLPIIQKSMNNMLFETKMYTELYTNEAIYQINSKNILLLEPTDGEIIVYKNYFNELSLIVDKSYFKKIEVSSVFGNNHHHKKIKKYIFKQYPKSKISFVIEMTDNLENDNYYPNDVYFEIDDLVDIKDLFIKQEIIEFLLLLI
jgi:hypothetical protein